MFMTKHILSLSLECINLMSEMYTAQEITKILPTDTKEKKKNRHRHRKRRRRDFLKHRLVIEVSWLKSLVHRLREITNISKTTLSCEWLIHCKIIVCGTLLDVMWKPGWEGRWGRMMDTSICLAKSFHCSPELSQHCYSAIPQYKIEG